MTHEKSFLSPDGEDWANLAAELVCKDYSLSSEDALRGARWGLIWANTLRRIDNAVGVPAVGIDKIQRVNTAYDISLILVNQHGQIPLDSSGQPTFHTVRAAEFSFRLRYGGRPEIEQLFQGKPETESAQFN